jgi:hypothetical protein
MILILSQSVRIVIILKILWYRCTGFSAIDLLLAIKKFFLANQRLT